jgi:ribonuclease G
VPAADSEDEEARREAGLGELPTAIATDLEQDPAANGSAAPESGGDEGDEDGLQSKPRRRGRRGGRRRSAAKAKATPE